MCIRDRGEYASWGNQWENGLAEAAFMTGLEKNVHAVGLACYAPMFANVDYVNWRPDMIWFDNHQVYGSCLLYTSRSTVTLRKFTQVIQL